MFNLGKRKCKMELYQKFLSHFGARGGLIYEFFAPGRVNLIGEHIDYNGGLVLPFATNLGTRLAIRKNGLKLWRFYSENKGDEIDIRAEYPIINEHRSWICYPLGVMELFANHYGFQLEGMDFYYSGDLPQSSGLSSSASIEAVTAIALVEISKINVDKTELAVLCQHAEHQFTGVQCGIMDQFACINAEVNHAILLNCGSLKYEHIPLHITDYEWVITNTNKPRVLVESAYNQRLNECHLALNEINRHAQDDFRFEHLCHISPLYFKELENIIYSNVLVKRARHAISEQQRVLDMVEALEMGKIKQVGKLLYESHDSLKNDFEVSCIELDTLVNKCKSLPFVAGSRMTGAGFGGCTVSLVQKAHLLDFESEITADYVEKTALIPSFYIVSPSYGAHFIKNEFAHVGM
jgi:galactokinase